MKEENTRRTYLPAEILFQFTGYVQIFWLWSTARKTGNEAVCMGLVGIAIDEYIYLQKLEVPPSFMVRQDYSVEDHPDYR